MVWFQSTPSLQKVTWHCINCISQFLISIHTFFAEGDTYNPQMTHGHQNFNPHLLCRRWRRREIHTGNKLLISIHTFFAEGDNKGFYCKHWYFYFNPHLLCRRWLAVMQQNRKPIQFQSTPSLQKVTYYQYLPPLPMQISIHTFFAEGDTHPEAPYSD